MQLLGKTDVKLNLCARLRDVIPACFSGHFKAIYVQQSAMLEAKARTRNRGLKRPSPSSALQHLVDNPVVDSVALRDSGPSPSRRGGAGDSSGYLCAICCEIAKMPVAAKLCGHVLCSQVSRHVFIVSFYLVQCLVELGVMKKVYILSVALAGAETHLSLIVVGRGILAIQLSGSFSHLEHYDNN